MEKMITGVRNKFIAIILLVIAFIVVLSWGILQFYNQREIAAPAHSTEVQQSALDNEALAAYLEQEEAYEAHFIALASSIKDQESSRVTRALAVTSIIAILVGVLVAIIVSKWLMKPVVKAYESQERFLQDAAHELRNPLAAMNAALQQNKDSSPVITTLKRQTKQLISINEDLLYLERNHKQDKKLVNISDLLMDVVEELQPLAHKKHINITVNTEDSITKAMSPSDYVKLMRNVISNAIKYSPDTSVVTVHQATSKNSISITVEDSGIGIPKEDLDKIGERFFRAKNTGDVSGTGLGLAIVQKILNTYGGSMTIKSQLGSGTEVSFSLPN